PAPGRTDLLRAERRAVRVPPGAQQGLLHHVLGSLPVATGQPDREGPQRSRVLLMQGLHEFALLRGVALQLHGLILSGQSWVSAGTVLMDGHGRTAGSVQFCAGRRRLNRSPRAAVITRGSDFAEFS